MHTWYIARVDTDLSDGVNLAQHDLLAFSFPNTQAEAYCISPAPLSRFGFNWNLAPTMTTSDHGEHLAPRL